MLVAGDYTEEKQALQRVLSSGIFDRAPSLAQVLSYVCEKYFDGTASEIKEYNIALDALGRPPEFDQKKDSIVRVQVHRLRERLAEYYANEGADQPIRIEIPQGQYVPSFIAQAIPEVEAAPVAELAPVTHFMEPAVAPNIAAPSQGKGAFLWIALGVALTACALIAVRAYREPKVPAASQPGIAPRAAAIAGTSVRIGVGQDMPYTDVFGQVWEADRNFTGGTVVKTPDRAVRGTHDSRLYQTRRQGLFAYDIPLPPGAYELRLHFAEVHYGENGLAGFGGENSRVFDVLVNGKKRIDHLDVIGEAGPDTVHVRVLKDISPDSDGQVHLKFNAIQGLPMLSGIEITPGTAGALQPIRIVMQSRPYTDPQGRIWLPDRFATGGQVVHREPLPGTPDPDLYTGERFGNLQYLIPVPPGKYTLNLYMAERWHGSDRPDGGGVGSRIFDIHLNGVLLAHDVDVIKRAGGPNRPLIMTYKGQEPNHQGYLALSFVPAKNYALINALEVLDEGK